jgi:hypothetical protein
MNNILVVTMVLILMGISLSACDSGSPDVEGLANQLVTEESYQSSVQACIDEPADSIGRCQQRFFQLKIEMSCVENKMTAGDCIVLRAHVLIRMIHHAEKASEKSRQFVEKIRQSTERARQQQLNRQQQLKK